jgi:hypothetical protein
LRLIVEDGEVRAINRVDVEEYLVSVISSEMSATSSLEFLKAHTIVSRSWLYAQLLRKDKVQQGVYDLCYDMPQLEYLGFDVAITQDGIKLPEINRAPGYPKIEKFTPLTNDYLLYKLEQKIKKHKVTKYTKKKAYSDTSEQ